MKKNTKRYSSSVNTGGEAAILNNPGVLTTSFDTPCPRNNKAGLTLPAPQESGSPPDSSSKGGGPVSFSSDQLRTVIDGFLGWTSEFLSFLLVGDTYALVDEDDLAQLRPITWYLRPTTRVGRYYAIAKCKKGNTRTTIAMHKLILPLPKGFDVDHKNRNGLDNRRENLRAATRSQNIANSSRRRNKNKHSRFKGVSKDKRKWFAQIKINYKKIHLGYYTKEVDAAKAYDRAALNYFGEFAGLNFPTGVEIAKP